MSGEARPDGDSRALGRAAAAEARQLHAGEGDDVKRVDPRAQAQRRRRLFAHPVAAEWLERELGLSREELEAEGFGLDLEYRSAVDGRRSGPWVTLPARDEGGRALRSLCKIAVPGVTAGAEAGWWKPGECLTFHLRPRRFPTVLVVELLDLCSLAARGPALQLDIAASTDAARWPLEWSDPAFWRQWSKIILALPEETLPAGMRRALSAMPASSIRSPPAADADVAPLRFRLRGGSSLARVLEDHRPRIIVAAAGPRAAVYRPLDLNKGFEDGRLHYLFEAVVGTAGPQRGAPETQRLQTMVVRSDGKLLAVEEVPAPPGTPVSKRLWRLSDGTIVDGAPKAPTFPSWSWAGIDGFLADPRQDTPRLGKLLNEVERALARYVWLPESEDFALLALVVAASYVQAVFRALPLVLVTGGPGSGKSTLGILLAALGCNGTIVGQMSAPAAARVIHETGGLVVLDDLEGIASRSRRATFTELIQWLKVSYNKDTASKAWIDAGRSMKTERLNGFGVKIVTNVGGADPILATRVFAVPAAAPPLGTPPCADLSTLDRSEIDALRDRLHLWAFQSVGEVAAAYQRVLAGNRRGRADEIAAPLRALASLAGDSHLADRLERAVHRGASPAAAPRAETLLRRAAVRLAAAGHAEVTPAQVLLEMRRTLAETCGAERARVEVPDPGSEWIGRELRTQRLVEAGATSRRRVRGANLRFTRLSADLPRPEAPAPGPFCDVCERCAYADLGCPIKARSDTRP